MSIRGFGLVGIAIVSFALVACSKGDTSVDTKEVTDGSVPSAFVGVYKGTLSAEAKSGPLSESTTDDITITVFEDNTIRFEGDDPDELFITKVGANGNFNGSLPIKTDDCEGTVNASGNVNGTIATGDIGGTGKCRNVSVGISGSFSANKQ